MTHICVDNLTIIGADQATSHNLNQCRNLVNWTLRNKFQWNLNRNSYIFILENAFENVGYEMAAILSHHRAHYDVIAMDCVRQECFQLPVPFQVRSENGMTCNFLSSLYFVRTRQHVKGPNGSWAPLMKKIKHSVSRSFHFGGNECDITHFNHSKTHLMCILIGLFKCGVGT